MRKLCFSIIALLLVRLAAYADDAHVTRVFVEREVNKLLETLNDKDLGPEQKVSTVKDIAYGMFDIETMAKLVVGRYRRQFSEGQMREFTDLFLKQIEASYFNKVESFGEAKFEYETAIQTNVHYYVPSHVDFRGERYSILYKLRRKNNAWRVWDVAVEGISIVDLNRKQYEEMLQNTSVEGLLIMMRKKNAEMTTDSNLEENRRQSLRGTNITAISNEHRGKE